MSAVVVSPVVFGWRKLQATVILVELLKKTNAAGHHSYKLPGKAL
ncbi:hypothetical protein [Lawsonella clevelandensis]|nr:hypothetical protein [Lawsonella clevelandensis]